MAATRKLGLGPEIAQRKVEILARARARVVRFSPADIIAAIELHRLTKVSFWLIVHAARTAGANVLYSEDLNSGGVLGGVRVVNPFAGE